MSSSSETPQHPEVSRRNLFKIGIGALAKEMFLGKLQPIVDQAENATPEERPLPLERWTSEVQFTLASLMRPGATESEKMLYPLLDLAYPFLISNASVATQAGDEIFLQCYVNGRVTGEDIGDQVKRDTQRRVYSLFLVIAKNKPNKAGLLIETTREPSESSDVTSKDFNPKQHPFDFRFHFFPSGAMLTENILTEPNQVQVEEVQSFIDEIWLDLTDGETITPPVELKKFGETQV